MGNTRTSRLGIGGCLVLAFLEFLLCAAVVSPQSGRKLKIVKHPLPAQASINNNSNSPEAQPVTAEKHEDYRCTGDGSLTRVVEPLEVGEVFTIKTVDVKAYISTRPKAGYTREARRAGVQGSVVLRLVLLSNAEIGTIRVLRGLPAGLTENAIRAACKVQFRPAIKNGKEVSQSVQIEYTFRLASPNIMR